MRCFACQRDYEVSDKMCQEEGLTMVLQATVNPQETALLFMCSAACFMAGLDTLRKDAEETLEEMRTEKKKTAS